MPWALSVLTATFGSEVLEVTDAGAVSELNSYLASTTGAARATGLRPRPAIKVTARYFAVLDRNAMTRLPYERRCKVDLRHLALPCSAGATISANAARELSGF